MLSLLASILLCFLFLAECVKWLSLPLLSSLQSPCVPCEAWQPRRSSLGSWPCSGSRWATTSPAATPTPCRCATATPCPRGAAGATTPPSESACPWSATCPTSPSETCRPSAPSTCGWRWPTPRARRRAGRSPSRPRRTVSAHYTTLWLQLHYGKSVILLYVCAATLYCHSCSALASDRLQVLLFLCTVPYAQIIVVHCLHKSKPLVIQYQQKKPKTLQILTRKISWISVTKWKISLLNRDQWNINQPGPWPVAKC